jgi:hypothetical protein
MIEVADLERSGRPNTVHCSREFLQRQLGLRDVSVREFELQLSQAEDTSSSCPREEHAHAHVSELLKTWSIQRSTGDDTDGKSTYLLHSRDLGNRG